MTTGNQLCTSPKTTVGVLVKVVSAANDVVTALNLTKGSVSESVAAELSAASDLFDKFLWQAQGLDHGAYAQGSMPRTPHDVVPGSGTVSISSTCVELSTVETAYASRNPLAVSADLLAAWTSYQRALGNQTAPAPQTTPRPHTQAVASTPTAPPPTVAVSPPHHAALFAFGGVLAAGVAFFGLRAIFGRRHA